MNRTNIIPIIEISLIAQPYIYSDMCKLTLLMHFIYQIFNIVLMRGKYFSLKVQNQIQSKDISLRQELNSSLFRSRGLEPMPWLKYPEYIQCYDKSECSDKYDETFCASILSNKTNIKSIQWESVSESFSTNRVLNVSWIFIPFRREYCDELYERLL